MIIQLTDAGAALQAAATSPLTMTSFRLGTGSNYVPDPSQTALVGTTVYTGLPGHPLLENQNTLKYPLYIGDSVGPITYGEIGLFYNNTLYAICVYEVLLTKLPLDPVQNVGGASVTDFYVPIVSDNYEMYANTTQANTGPRFCCRSPVFDLNHYQLLRDSRPAASVLGIHRSGWRVELL
jgi:hypothetical protein